MRPRILIVDDEPNMRRSLGLLLADLDADLVDAEDGGRSELTAQGADPGGDDNPCLPPRQATFDPLGQRLGFKKHIAK